MTKLNSVKNKISNEYRIVSGKDLSNLLAEFFNGEFIQAREEFTDES